jgi:hypothetical protein
MLFVTTVPEPPFSDHPEPETAAIIETAYGHEPGPAVSATELEARI